MANAPYSTSCRVDDGKLYVRNKRRLDAFVADATDGEYTLTLERAHATRSAAQNAYYHAVLVKNIADHTGHTAGETHEVLKAMHLPHDAAANGENGRLMNGLVIGGSTTRLNKLAFIEFIERIQQWAATELDLVLPDPDPEWREQAERELPAEDPRRTMRREKGQAA